MEDLGEILKRLAIKNSSVDRPFTGTPEDNGDIEQCKSCGGRGWLVKEVPVGHPEFGQVDACGCQKQDMEQDQYSRLLSYSNLGSLAKFTFTSIESIVDQTSDNDESFQSALEVAREYSADVSGWLVLIGPNGSGKTRLAASIANSCLDDGQVVFFAHVPDLLDHLRASFDPASEMGYSVFFEQVKSAPVLILDGLGNHSTTSWAEEKLGQIINHRYNAELPTVITTATSLESLDPYISSRIRSTGLSRIVELHSNEEKSSIQLGSIDHGMVRRMTLEKFDIEGNASSLKEQESLGAAFRAAEAFANDPDGWLILSGQTGVGKTHLAVAIAGTQISNNRQVLFAFVPELMDYLRDTFNPRSQVSYDNLFEEVKNTPILILDDLGKEQRSDWAVEKLYQIIVHRHNVQLPTVITSMMDFSDELDPITSRVQDPSISVLIRIEAHDYRNKQRRRGRSRSKSK